MTIDTKIASIKLDNSQFKKAADDTIKSINKLNESMDFESSADSLDDVSKAMKDLPTDAMTKDVEEATSKFSIFGEIASGALRKIGADIETYVASKLVGVVKDLSGINNITAGYEKYETVTNAVQVLTANTDKSVSEVQERIDSLRWYSDETSYSLNDMTDALAKFTNAGVDIDVATEAIQGIGSWAAASGVDAKKAASAFYNLSQAMGMGYLGGMDAKSIQMLNMLGPEFKETAIAAGIAAGKVEDLGNGLYKAVGGSEEFSVESMSESLKDKWLDVDVLNTTLKQYSKYSTDLKKYMEEAEAAGEGFDTSAQAMVEFDKYIRENGLETEYALSQKAFKMGQVAKTFGEAVDATKDAASSSWYSIIQSIFGDLDEAKKLWTAVTNEMWDVFVGPIDYLDGIFKEWHDAGGRDDLLEGLKEIYLNVKEVVGVVKQVFTDAFGAPTVESLLNISKRIKEFGQSIKPTERFINGLRNAAIGLTNVIKFAIYLAKEAYDNIKVIFQPIVRIVKTLIFSFASLFKSVTNGLDDVDNKRPYIDYILNAIRWIAKVLNGLFTVLEHGIYLVKTFFSAFTGVFKSLMAARKQSGTLLFEDSLINFNKIIGKPIQLLSEFYNKLKEFASYLSREVAPKVAFFASTLATLAFDKMIKVLAFINYEALPFIRAHLEYIRDAVKDLVENFDIKEKFNNAKSAVSDFFSKFKKEKEKTVGPEWLDKDVLNTRLATKRMQELTNTTLPKFKEALRPFDKNKFFTGLSKGLDETTSKTDKIKTIFEVIGNFFKATAKRIKDFFISVYNGIDNLTGGRLKEAVNSIKDLIGKVRSGEISIWMIIENLIKAGIIKKFIGFLVGLKKDKGTIVESFGKIGESIAKVGESVSKVLSAIAASIKANALLKLAAAIGLLVVALLSMISIPTDKLAKSGVVITTFIAELMIALETMSTSSVKEGFATSMIAKSFTKIATAVLILVASLKLLSTIPAEKIDSGIMSITLVMTILTASLKILESAGGADKVGKGMSKISTALLKITAVIWILGSIKEEKSIAGIRTIGVVLGMLTASMTLINRTATDVTGASKAINSISKFLTKFAIAMLVLSFIDKDKMIKSVGALAVILSVVTVFTFILSSMSSVNLDVSVIEKMNGAINTLSWFMIKMSAAMFILGKLSPDSLMASAISLTAMAAISIIIMYVMGQLAKDVKIDTDKLDLVSGLLGKVSTMMLKIAAALLILGKVPVDSIVAGTAAIGIMSLITMLLLNLMVSLSKDAEKHEGGMNKISKLVSNISAAVLIMSYAIKNLGKLNPEQMLTAVGGLLAITLSIYFLVTLLEGKSSHMGRISKGLAMMAGVIVILSAAMWVLGTIPDVMGAVICLAAVVVSIIVLSKFTKNLRSLGRGLSAIASAVVKLLVGIATAFTVFAAGLGALAAGIGYLTKVAIIAGSFGPQIEKGLTIIGDVITTVLKAVVKAIFECLYDITENLKIYGPKIIDNIMKFLVDGLKAINDNLPTLLDEVGKFILSIVNEFVELTPKILEKLGELLDKILDWLKENLRPFLDKLTPLIEDIAGWLGDTTIKLLNDLSDWIDKNYYELIDAAWNVITSLLRLILGLLGGWSTNAKFAEFREDVTGFAKEVMESLGEGFTRYVEVAVEAFQTLGEEIKKKLEPVIQYVEKFLNKIEDYWDALTYTKQAEMEYDDFLKSHLITSNWDQKWIDEFRAITSSYVTGTQGLFPKYYTIGEAMRAAQKYVEDRNAIYSDEEYSRLMGLFYAYTNMDVKTGNGGQIDPEIIKKFSNTNYNRSGKLAEGAVVTFESEDGTGHGASVGFGGAAEDLKNEIVQTALTVQDMTDIINNLNNSAKSGQRWYDADLSDALRGGEIKRSPTNDAMLVINGDVALNIDVDDMMSAKDASSYIRQQILAKASADAAVGKVGNKLFKEIAYN